MLLPYWGRQELSYLGQCHDILQIVLNELNCKMLTAFSFWTESGLTNLKILSHVAWKWMESIRVISPEHRETYGGVLHKESDNTGYLHYMSTSPLPHLDRLFHSSSDNYMETFLDAPFRFSSCFKLILGTSPIHSYESFTCSSEAEDQTETLEPVLKSVNCRNSFLQQVKIAICEIVYPTSLDWSLQFKCSSNTSCFPTSLFFFFPFQNYLMPFFFIFMNFNDSPTAGVVGVPWDFVLMMNHSIFSAVGLKQ